MICLKATHLLSNIDRTGIPSGLLIQTLYSFHPDELLEECYGLFKRTVRGPNLHCL